MLAEINGIRPALESFGRTLTAPNHCMSPGNCVPVAENVVISAGMFVVTSGQLPSAQHPRPRWAAAGAASRESTPSAAIDRLSEVVGGMVKARALELLDAGGIQRALL